MTNALPLPFSRYLIAFIALCLLLIASMAHAQTGPCPTNVSQTTFVVSPTRGFFDVNLPDHNAVDQITQQPLVVGYEVQFFDEAVDPSDPNTAPIQTPTNIGKPTPQPAGGTCVWYGQGTSIPIPAYPAGRRIKAVIVAVGQGTTRSPRGAAATSNPFGRPGPVTAPSAPTGHRVTGA